MLLTTALLATTPKAMAKKAGAEGGAIVRGTKLVKKAIEAGRAEALAAPEPVAAGLLKKLTLPNGEGISSSLKELLKVDASWLGIDFDEDEGDIEAVTFEEAVEDFFGEDARLFAEASELFDGDCVVLGGEGETLRVLYVGEADESGEYAVITASKEAEPWVQLAPFDVWLAQALGALPAGEKPGAVPANYEDTVKELADANSDGRAGFSPTPGEAREGDEDEDEDEDEEDDDEDGEDDEGEGDAEGEDEESAADDESLDKDED